MIYITLVCNMGMSTSMLMNKMRKSAIDRSLEVDIVAMADSNLPSSDRHTDILLLGPQLSFMLEGFKERYKDKIPYITVVNQMDYGMMNGEKVLDDALAMLS
ncbi:putative PTS system enzyme II [Lacrimispora amygdalina]|uniref:PTS sugar transporter subunit IIB n=1 Tax=Lacrimispora amygdalina TaxID=253257 RepID=A0A3E2NDX4_9FIRM|nr:PTS sugar transporter subunit IIB [Clostridium indicum]RFZ79195.1 PTS sugar transporter subunit IIB [Clostridium indicum]